MVRLQLFLFFCLSAMICFGQDIDEIIHMTGYNYDVDLVKSIITFEDDFSIMRVKENDYFAPVQNGKVLVYMKKHDWADVTLKGREVSVIFEQSETPGFIYGRISAMLPSDGLSGYIPTTSKVTYIYKRGSNVYSIFLDGVTMVRNERGEAEAGFYDDVVIPGASRMYVEQRFDDVYETLNWLGLDTDLTTDLQSQLQIIYDGLFGTGKVTYDEEEPYDDKQKLTKWNGEIEPLHLEPGQVLYANSDEVFHLWIDENRKDAYIVDVGSMYLANGLAAVLDDISEIETLYITPTHFHADHVQGLASLINRTDVPQITLVISTGLNLEFIGWFLQYYTHLIEKINTKQLNFVFGTDEEWVKVGALEVKLLLSNKFEDNRCKHFITNTSPVFRDINGNHKIFTGDLQPPSFIPLPKEHFFEMIASSFSQVFAAAEIPQTSHIDHYFGVGLFYSQMLLYPWQIGDEYRITVGELREVMYETFAQYPYYDLRQIHRTDDLGFNMALHQSFQKVAQLKEQPV